MEFNAMFDHFTPVALLICVQWFGLPLSTTPASASWLSFIYTEPKRIMLSPLLLLSVNSKLDFLWTHLGSDVAFESLARHY